MNTEKKIFLCKLFCSGIILIAVIGIFWKILFLKERRTVSSKNGSFFSNLSTPEWMKKQITTDLEYYIKHPCSKEEFESILNVYYDLFPVKFTISNNQISYTLPSKSSRMLAIVGFRLNRIYDVLTDLALKYALPDITFYITLHDAISRDFGPFEKMSDVVPIFTSCKLSGVNGILMPDFEALACQYQNAFGNIDIQSYDYSIPFRERIDKLVFRGTASYQVMANKETLDENRRFKLARLSQEYSQLIDAGLTGGNANVEFSVDCLPYFEKYSKSKMPWEKILSHKYQMWVDGWVSSYSNSGWKLYSGSCVIKSESKYVQWYYEDMEPGVHYISVKEDLSDLVDTLLFLQQNQDYAERIGKNGLNFAREHINYDVCLLYLKELFWEYSKLSQKR